MSELFEPVDEHDWRIAIGATGLLATFNEAGLLTSSDLHVATRVGALGGESDERVLLAVALAVRAVRRGSVCLDLATVAATAPELPWPEEWPVAGSPLVHAGVVRFEHGLLYLDRYHRLERQVHDDLAARLALAPPAVNEQRLEAALGRLSGGHFSPEQRDAVVAAVRRRTTILTGGPGTGKTTTVARLLALLADQAAGQGAGQRAGLSIALAAPTGKAATRLQEAVTTELAAVASSWPEAPALVGRLDGLTLHRLLGWRPDNATRFRHDRANRLKYDVVVVDESSMVELTMMGRLLEALRSDSRLVLVGDPQQLTSVGAGAVLSDLVAGYEGRADSPVVQLSTNFRSEEDIKSLAAALRSGDPDEVVRVLRTPSDQVSWVETADEAEVEAALRADSVAAARAVWTAARAEDPAAALAELDHYRLLCAHREGPYGVRRWNHLVERWLAEDPEVDPQEVLYSGEWYVGRPLLVTSNDYALDVYNGESGVVVRQEQRRRVFIAGSERLKEFAPGRLDAVETMHAMTIHKSQGSQADRVSVLLPDEGSRLLTRELFYTAVTRARHHVRVVGSEAAVRAAVTTRAHRATGLPRRLAEGLAAV